MLVVVEVHRLRIDVRLQRVVGIGQRRQREGAGRRGAAVSRRREFARKRGNCPSAVEAMAAAVRVFRAWRRVVSMGFSR